MKNPGRIISLNFILLLILVSVFLIGLIKIQTSLGTRLTVILSIYFLFLSFLISFLRQDFKNKVYYYLKIYIFICLIGVTIFTTIFSQIVFRHQTEPHLFVHDNVIQIEEAIKFVLKGKNPYIENYFGTPLENWAWPYPPQDYNPDLYPKEYNPSIYHTISLPFHFLFSLPFYLLSQFFIGFYDQRFLYLLLFLLSLFLLYKIPQKEESKFSLLILFSFNPLFIHHFIQGVNDIFVFFWLLLTFYCLKSNRVFLASLVFGLALISKHSAWLFLPFYFFYLFYQNQDKVQKFFSKIKFIFKKNYLLLVIPLVFLMPFGIWDFNSFIEDIYHYPAGTIATSYPIWGQGFSDFMIRMGFIGSRLDYYPFWILQLIWGLPLLYFLWWIQRANNTLSLAIINYGVLLFVFWFFSRFFNENYIGFLIMILVTGYFITDGKIFLKSPR